MGHLPALTANAQKLIARLAALPRTWVTAATLAEGIGVSRRTVLRELPGVEQWMQAAGFSFLRSPGQGLLLDEPPERRTEIGRLLGGSTVFAGLPRRERRQQLLSLLLRTQEPVKIASLAHTLAVSEHTLSADLDAAGRWLSPYGLELCRRTGVGVWVSGGDNARRKAAAALLRSSLPEKELQAVLSGKLPAGRSFSALMEPAVAETVWRVLQQFEKDERFHLPDAGFLALAIHCTLAIQQLRANGSKGRAPKGLRKADGPAARLAARLNESFHLTLPDAETRYLGLYLDAYLGGGEAWGDIQELHLRHLAETLIGAVEQELGADLSSYVTLRDGLYCHLRPMLLRVEQCVRTENPQLDTIRTSYPHLWAATRAACDAAEEMFGLPHIPDDEAGYLAMHFGAVLEQDAMNRLRLRTVVVCPFGMGSSRFLATRLANEFPSFQIEGCCSVRELDVGDLRRRGIDLLVSTVPLEIGYPAVCVSPALLEQDRTLLRDAAEQLTRARAERPGSPPARVPAAPPPASGLRYYYPLTRSMMEVLDYLSIRQVSAPGGRQALLHAAAQLFCPQEDSARLVEQQLRRREELGDTYLKPLYALLLHCRTSAVPGCRFGYLQAQPPVYEPGKVISCALVLLAPDDDPVSVETMQLVSAQLIEEPALMQALRAGEREQAAALLEQKFDRRLADGKR